MERIYVVSAFDLPGVVAANNYLSFFMPSTSNKYAVALLVNCWSYTIGASSTAQSMQIDRISAASGGTLEDPTKIPRFVSADEDPVMQARTGNPTVTNTARFPLVAYPPPISTGAGTGSSTAQAAPAGALFTILPGNGICFNTAAGNTNQVWSLQFIWQEIYLPPS